MLDRIRGFRELWLALPVVWLIASCSVGSVDLPVGEDAGTSSSSTGMDLGPCGVDCSAIETPQCTVAVCNTGQEVGPIGSCVVIPAPTGTSCDDGKFCTIGDSCDGNGACVGGGENNCGLKLKPCESILCYEELHSCDTLPLGDGAPCTPDDLCKVNGVCKIGACIGQPKDCSFSPQTECNQVKCESATGKCVGTPDPAKDGLACVLTGDLCMVGRACLAGNCVGGEPKNCSALNVGCSVGVCNPDSGACGPEPAAAGTACSDGIGECHVGECDTKGACQPTPAPNGVACNDYNACTKSDTCMAGSCAAGDPVEGCSAYIHEGFETCSNGWTFGGDWECGTPINVGPPSAYIGTSCIGTQIAANYHVNQAYNTALAKSPTINLTNATAPMVSFWAWDHTEGGSFDGWNLKVSINGGTTFTQVTTVTPPYPLSIAGQPAWGGDHAAEGWKNYMADLTAFAGQSIVLAFSFRSDGASVRPGVYIDEVVVAEPVLIPLHITTTSPLTDVYTDMSFAAQINKIGGTPNSEWKITSTSPNGGWLNIGQTTGLLYGTPKPADKGPVTVTVRVYEPTQDTNFAEKTFTFNVKPNAYYTSFEDMCPADWTLTGDWECGTPANVGPTAPYVGQQCIATKIGGLYSNLDTYTGTTATSPEIDLTTAVAPVLTFRMWIDTEGSTYDGVNLQISTDGGMTYSVVNGVSPAYPLTIGGLPAWGGHLGALGWQFMQADLSPYSGQKVLLRFAFRSDQTGNFPGVYIDDFFIE